MPSIVNVTVTQTVAPTPSTLQQMGAAISQGATNTSIGTSTFLAQASDLTTLLVTPLALTSTTTATGTVTATTTTAHGYPVGQAIWLTIAGVSVSGYNGTWLCTITTTTEFTYTVPESSLSAGSGGTVTPDSAIELTQMVDTFFAQGTGVGLYVLELGVGSVASGISTLSSYLTANPNSNYTPGATGYFYAYLVPRTWDAATSYLSLVAEYESDSAQTYFYTTTTLATYASYTKLMKCVNALIESPSYGVYPANALTALTYSSGTVTATTTTSHGVVPGNWFTIAGCTPAGYNGTFQALPGTTGTTLLYSLSSNPGSETVLGTLVASLYANTGVTGTEFSQAAGFYQLLVNAPSAANKVAPMAFRYVTGVTAFPTRGQSSLLTTLKTANINVIGTGAEGGISKTILLRGTSLDGHDQTYWYSVDWVQINVN
ncbi:MAG: hypothetical protein B7X10_00940, partial [Burkholderiales bacterium 21-58-4]